MSKKQEFITYIEDNLMSKVDMNEVPEGVRIYWENFKGKEEEDKPVFTETGKLILGYLQEHQTDMPIAKAKDIGEGLFVSSRRVSGSIRKLVAEGYVEKIGQDPVVYELTEKGRTANINE
jgi:DNA-binding MarR family transcriptional regulator